MKKLTLLIAIIPFFAGAQAPCITNSNSVSFASSYIQLAANTDLDITDSITVEAWIYPTAFGVQASDNSIVCKHGWSQGEKGYVLRCGSTGILSFNIGGMDINGIPTSWKTVASPSGAVTLNTWQHVAGSYDGDSLRLFVNGIQVASIAFIGSIVSSAAYNMCIGRLSDLTIGQTRYFAGRMDEIRIWHRALSALEIQSNYNHHIIAANVNDLVGYWRLNEGSGLIIADSSGNSINGTLTNGPTWTTFVPFNEVPAQPTISYSLGVITSSVPTGNQWFLNGTAIPGATQQSYTPTQAGQYTVMVTSVQGCTALSNPITLNSQGIEDLSFTNQISIYPIPAIDKLNIEISADIIGALAQISDVQGRIVLKSILTESYNSVSLSTILNGVYTLEIIKEKILYRKQIVKQ